jgi:hypothetical protein
VIGSARQKNNFLVSGMQKNIWSTGPAMADVGAAMEKQRRWRSIQVI